MCQFGFLVEKHDPVKVMLWPLESHSGVHFDDMHFQPQRIGRGKSPSPCPSAQIIKH